MHSRLVARTNDAWLAGLRSADAAVQAEVAADLADFVRRTIARGFGRQLDDATLDDIGQESMLRIHDKLDSYRGKSQFTTWAAAIATNLALGELRRRKYQHVELSEVVAEGRELLQPAQAPARVQTSQRAQLLRQAMERALTERQREAMYAELAGMPLNEIARQMGSNRGALYKLLHESRKRMRAYLLARGVSLSELVSADDGIPEEALL